jgi:hypothetical protein
LGQLTSFGVSQLLCETIKHLWVLYGYTAYTGLPQHIGTLGRLIVKIVAASLTLPSVAKYLELKLSVPSFMSKIASSDVSDSKSGACKFLLYTKYFSEL